VVDAYHLCTGPRERARFALQRPPSAQRFVAKHAPIASYSTTRRSFAARFAADGSHSVPRAANMHAPAESKSHPGTHLARMRRCGRKCVNAGPQRHRVRHPLKLTGLTSLIEYVRQPMLPLKQLIRRATPPRQLRHKGLSLRRRPRRHARNTRGGGGNIIRLITDGTSRNDFV
jgi:hypothetical protein